MHYLLFYYTHIGHAYWKCKMTMMHIEFCPQKHLSESVERIIFTYWWNKRNKSKQRKLQWSTLLSIVHCVHSCHHIILKSDYIIWRFMQKSNCAIIKSFWKAADDNMCCYGVISESWCDGIWCVCVCVCMLQFSTYKPKTKKNERKRGQKMDYYFDYHKMCVTFVKMSLFLIQFVLGNNLNQQNANYCRFLFYYRHLTSSHPQDRFHCWV